MAAEPSVSKGMKGDLYRRGETRVHICGTELRAARGG